MTRRWRKVVPAADRASAHLFPLLAALVWTAGWGAFYIFGLTQLRSGLADKFVAFIPVAIGLACIWWQGREIVRRLREGAAVLVLMDAPPVVGGRLKAMLLLPFIWLPASRVTVELACVRDRNGDRDAPNPYSSGKVWHVQQELDAGIRVDFEFPVPADALPTGKWQDDKASEHEIGWQVRISAALKDRKLERVFDISMPRQEPEQSALGGLLRDIAAYALIAANLAPLALLYYGRADVAALAYLYWTENLIVAAYMLLRVIKAGRGTAMDRLGGVLFFVFWFAGVSVFLGRVMLGVLLDLPRGWEPPSLLAAGVKVVHTIAVHVIESGMVLAVLGLVISHGITYHQNYIANGRYLQASANGELERLMARGVITFGAVFLVVGAASLKSTTFVLAVLVLAKTYFDVWSYNRDKREAVATRSSIITAI